MSTDKEPTKEEIEDARQSEPAEYITFCQRLLLLKTTGKHFGFSSRDTSAFDKIIFPNVLVSITRMLGGKGIIICNKNCPGYTPIPVEEFSLTSGLVVRCQRLVPKELLEKFGGWEGLRKSALEIMANSPSCS
jgi:hypothetical protein